MKHRESKVAFGLRSHNLLSSNTHDDFNLDCNSLLQTRCTIIGSTASIISKASGNLGNTAGHPAFVVTDAIFREDTKTNY